MDRSKTVAVITGVISLVLAIAYLTIVQIIDFRGEMLPAPVTLDMVSSHSILGVAEYKHKSKVGAIYELPLLRFMPPSTSNIPSVLNQYLDRINEFYQ